MTRDRIYRIALRHIRDPDMADDFTQWYYLKHGLDGTYNFIKLKATRYKFGIIRSEIARRKRESICSQPETEIETEDQLPGYADFSEHEKNIVESFLSGLSLAQVGELWELSQNDLRQLITSLLSPPQTP